MNNPNKIIIHHSATPDGLVLKDFDAIRNYHINTNGWLDIGYHYVIESVANEYKIIKGRPEEMEGAHCPGENQQSIGICVVGDFTNAEPTDAQYLTLVYCIKDIYKRHGELPVYGHKNFYNTGCPGILNIDKVRNLLNPQPQPQQEAPIETIDQALELLVSKGRIDPNYPWKIIFNGVKFLDQLIIRWANDCRKVG